MPIHICAIGQRGSDVRGEWVSVANDGLVAAPLTPLMVTDFTATQQVHHAYRFPGAQGGGDLMLDPGNTAYVFTSPGTDERREDGDLLLFGYRNAPIWNNTGDVAYLRRVADGTIVSYLTVGDPTRHPGGHKG